MLAMKGLGRTFFRIFLLLGVFVLMSSWTNNEEWRTYTYRSGNFKIALPGTPETHRERAMTIRSRSKTGTYYMISFNQHDFLSQNPADIQAALQRQASTYHRSLGGVVEQEQATNLGGLPARRYHFKSANGVHIHYLVAISRDRIYQLSAMSILDYPQSEQFFASFELLSR